MRTIIAGGRDITDILLVEQAVCESGFEITYVVSGKARGVDTLGEQWAEARGIPVLSFPANWDKYGKAAGAIRNKEMAENADALIAIWDGVSLGTGNMVSAAFQKGLKVFVLNLGRVNQQSLW